MLDELLDFWWHVHSRRECDETAARMKAKCPYCESNRTGRSISDLMEE